MKHRIAAGCMSLVMLLCLSGCGSKNKKIVDTDNQTTVDTAPTSSFDEVEFSELYMVGFDFGSYELLANDPVVECRVRYDQKMEMVCNYPQGRNLVERILVFDMTDEQFAAVQNGIDLEELYNLDPKVSDPGTVMDGGDTWLFMYGKDNEILRKIGGFCPTGEEYKEMRRVLFDNMPEKLVSAYYDMVRRSKFEWQYSNTQSYGVFLGTEDDLKNFTDYRIIVIDAQYYTKEEIQSFQSDINFVLSYINVGSIEDFRPYYAEYEDLTLGDYENWEGEKWVDVSSERWQSFILDELAPSLLDKGIDGFFVDNCDVYYQYENDAMLTGLATIMQGLVAMNKEVIMNGGDTFLEAYTENIGEWYEVITGINQESVITKIDFDTGFLGAREDGDEDMEYFKEYVEKYGDLGAYIFLLEYSQDEMVEHEIKQYCREHNFVYYLSDSLALDG